MILATLFVTIARLPLKRVSYRLLVVNGLVLLLWVFLPFTTDGSAVFTVGSLVATREGLIHSALITLKSNAIVLTLMAFISTMSIFTMGRALSHLYVPAKMVHLLIFTYRYIHVIYQEYQRLLKAVKIRGFRPGTNMHTYQTYAYLVGILIIKSYDRAKRVRAAMLCRGFKGAFYDLSEFCFKTSDWILMIFMSLASTGIGLLQWT